MGIKTEIRSDEGTTMYIVTIGGRKVAFADPNDAIHFCNAMKIGKHITTTPWSFRGASFMFDKDCETEHPELSTEKVLQATSVEGIGKEYFVYECDHHIIKDISMCGVSKCYQSIEPARGDELLKAGWRVLYGVRLKPESSPVDLVTCPSCIARIAEQEGCEVNRVDEVMIFEARKFELEVIERKKNS